MATTYAPEQLAAIAEQTAQEVGCEVVRWWVDQSWPGWLCIEAERKLSGDRAFTVRLAEFLPEEHAAPPAST